MKIKWEYIAGIIALLVLGVLVLFGAIIWEYLVIGILIFAWIIVLKNKQVVKLWRTEIIVKENIEELLEPEKAGKKPSLLKKELWISQDQLKEIKDAVKTGDLTILNHIKLETPKKTFLPGGPVDVAVLSIEKNGGEFRFDIWNNQAPGVVRNNDRGRAADLGEAVPVTFVILGTTYQGFIIDGDRGVSLKLDGALFKLTTTAAEAWSFLQTEKLRSYLTDNLTGRQIALYIIIGVIIGQLVFLFLRF
jgi:hypothetical protein